jgi:cytoskeletal protein RodZ
MSKYLVSLIFVTALMGLSANSPVVHAQTNQQATEQDEANQPNEGDESNQTASPNDSTQSDERDTSEAEQPAEEPTEDSSSDHAGPQDQE